jgi:hypothetical protein
LPFQGKDMGSIPVKCIFFRIVFSFLKKNFNIILTIVKNSLLYIVFVSEIRVLTSDTFFSLCDGMVDVVDLKSAACSVWVQVPP